MSAPKKKAVVSAEVKLATQAVVKCQKAVDATSIKLEALKKLMSEKKFDLLKAKDALKTLKG